MKKNIANLLIVVLMAMLLGACGEKAQVDTAESVGQVMFKGSSTLAPVVTTITKEYMEANGTWDKVNEDFPKEEIDIAIGGGGSGAGIKALLDKSANFGMVSRNVSEDEKKSIEGYKEYKLGTDALTISVNPSNKIYEIKDGLSTEELKKIFSGEYTHWNQVDSRLSNEEIVLVTRDVGGGAHKVFKKKIMGDVKVSDNVIQSPSMGALVNKIIENKNAIGYASFGVVNQNKDKIIPLNVDGVSPSVENIKDGKYKISRPLLVIKSGELNPYEKAIIDKLLSEDGLKVVEQLGFVPQK
ncbi:MAG: phosphate ABC transporter substrate-binding protein [Anaeromicrobium sp.]|jgi:phosphate transport system substrate-binding protein|uniref:phosphate ABC transporter substrate-binding protein n=1 Tax=Anaeromicrobium sp. TaxID=1929132 RepID=UPI0025CBC819|nr:phosphate ABC transporter substrate-binding protein [Anaeromicrobium sp.]MCT4592988.1 phosphate ABC transporter substrate-binding protein [Anaeromicrobium sp.]